MPATIEIDNFGPNDIKEKTYLASDVAVTASPIALPTKSAQNITADLYALIGTPGNESAEIKRITSVSGQSITVPSLSQPHSQFDDVTVLIGNQKKIYRAPNVDGSKPALADFLYLGTVTIDEDELATTYVDADGGADYWYLATTYNQASAAETDKGDSIAMRGGGVDIYATVDQIRDEAGMSNNPYIGDGFIDEQRVEAQNTIDSGLSPYYTVPFETPVPALIERMTKVLAAGYILKVEYGQGSIGTTNAGQAKIDEVLGTKDKPGLLQQIASGALPLTDATGAALASNQRIDGWPNTTTATTAVKDGGSVRRHRMGQVY